MDKIEPLPDTFPKIFYKISNTPMCIARHFGHARTKYGKYIYIKQLDIVVHESQAKLIAELRKITKPYEIMNKRERELVGAIISSNLR